jgi:hypothetical protein
MTKTPISTKQPFELSVAELTALLAEPFKTVEVNVTDMLDLLTSLTDADCDE